MSKQAGSTVPPTRALTPLESVRSDLTRMEAQFAMVLPSHIKPEKFIRVVVTALQLNSDLLNCDRQSLYAASMKSAQDGLVPDGREAALVQFKGRVQYMPMVFGVCKKARNSGEIATIDSQVVYENDEYESWVDEKGPHFKHKKARKDRGEPSLTYAYAITKDGAFFLEEVDEEQMASIEAMARAQAGPWKGPFKDEMRRKTAIKRLAKYRIPSSSDLDEVLRRNDDMYDVDTAKEPTEAPKSRVSRIVEEAAGEPEHLKASTKDKPAASKPADPAIQDAKFAGEEPPI